MGRIDSCTLVLTQNYELATLALKKKNTFFKSILDVNQKDYVIVIVDNNDTTQFLFGH